jgi:hypothetical protein
VEGHRAVRTAEQYHREAGSRFGVYAGVEQMTKWTFGRCWRRACGRWTYVWWQGIEHEGHFYCSQSCALRDQGVPPGTEFKALITPCLRTFGTFDFPMRAAPYVPDTRVERHPPTPEVLAVLEAVRELAAAKARGEVDDGLCGERRTDGGRCRIPRPCWYH